MRKKILAKYLEEFEATDGLYDFVYMYSHRQRFLTQIEKAHSKIFTSSKSRFSEAQQRLLSASIKFKTAECDLIYELMFNSKRQLGDEKPEVIRKEEFLRQLAELEKLAKDTQDRIVEIRLDGFRDAGRALGLLD